MANKQDILDNVSEYSADQLVAYVQQGVVTFDELCNDTDGEFKPNVRREVKQLLANAEPNDWNQALTANTITAYQIYLQRNPAGAHAADANAAIAQLQAAGASAQLDAIWNSVDKDDVESLKAFIQGYPDSNHTAEAQQLVNELMREQFLDLGIDTMVKEIKNIAADKSILDPNAVIKEKIENYIKRRHITKDDLIGKIAEDHNLLNASVVKGLLEDGFISYEDFVPMQISRNFVGCMLEGKKPKDFGMPEPLDHIDRQSTEVYFWGIPSSGKSCVLGAILSVANGGTVARTMVKDNACQGYGYMTHLSTIFKGNGSIGVLPGGTPTKATYEMGFDLVDDAGLDHPITCIDLAGELVRCMYKNDAGEDMTEDEAEALDTLTRVLIDNRTKNRKLHFFVLEYGAEDREYEGLTQSVYLDAALRYIDNTGIFKSETDGIYLMVSKADKAKAASQTELFEKIRTYIRDNYLGFYNGLDTICEKNEINGGHVEMIPFSLGEVCFQDYCKFDEISAANVVRVILNATKGFKQDKFTKFLNRFKG